MKTIKGKNYFYALICDYSDDPGLCGVYSTKNEAEEVKEEIKDCPLKHKILRCKVEIKI